MKVKIVAITDLGKERTINEDAFIICPDLSQQDWSLNETPSYIHLNTYGSLIVVADGMGGANAGDVASSIAMKSIKETLTENNLKHFLDLEDTTGLLNLCIKNADEAILKHIWKAPDTSGMGTTVVVCWILNQTVHIAWCGDSRCYIFNPYDGLKQLTKDHSYVQELVDKGEITEKEAFTHPNNNIITRGLGDVDSQTSPDIISYPLAPNDSLLLCSDGLCGYCTNKELEKVMQSNYMNVVKCRDELLKLALCSGGFDNITIALVSIISDQQSLPITLTVKQRLLNIFKKKLLS